MATFSDPWLITAVLLIIAMPVAGALAWVDRRFRRRGDPVADAVDALLPQTQCAQCGFAGCRPYAEAVAAGAPLNLCPPGGTETQQALARLLDRPAGKPPEPPPPQIARIDEAACIGCFRCVEACPVDAIVGAPQLLHTVLESECTGCELCLPPCPVDCITLDPVREQPDPRPLRILARSRRRWPEAPEGDCIRCGNCVQVCPEDLLPQELYWYCRTGAWDAAAERGLQACIECGRCNQVCLANIDLLHRFTRGRQALAAREAADAEADTARKKHERHEERVAARAAGWERRRRERMNGKTQRPWLH